MFLNEALKIKEAKHVLELNETYPVLDNYNYGSKKKQS
jgi:hypothetical protein